MAAVTEVGSTLLFKCLDFCQALSSQGQVFNFSVAIGPDFTFSMDTRSKAASPVSKKKASPSTLKRNARRREDYLKRKHNPSSVNSIEEVEVASNVLNCDLCDYKAASEKGLKTHKRMKHGPPRLTPPTATPSSPETLRGPGQMRSALNTSPILPFNREENCHNCGGPFSPSHQCESGEAEEPTSPPQPQLHSEDDECDCRLESDTGFIYCCKDTDCDHPDNCECKTKPCRCCQPGK